MNGEDAKRIKILEWREYSSVNFGRPFIDEWTSNTNRFARTRTHCYPPKKWCVKKEERQRARTTVTMDENTLNCPIELFTDIHSYILFYVNAL